MNFNVVTDLSNSFHPYPKQKKDRKQDRSGQIKQKSNKLANKERKRFSILQSKKECFICKCKVNLDKHEAFGGCNRQKSMKWGLVYYLCRRCHRQVDRKSTRLNSSHSLLRPQSRVAAAALKV